MASSHITPKTKGRISDSQTRIRLEECWKRYINWVLHPHFLRKVLPTEVANRYFAQIGILLILLNNVTVFVHRDANKLERP